MDVLPHLDTDRRDDGWGLIRTGLRRHHRGLWTRRAPRYYSTDPRGRVCQHALYATDATPHRRGGLAPDLARARRAEPGDLPPAPHAVCTRPCGVLTPRGAAEGHPHGARHPYPAA